MNTPILTALATYVPPAVSFDAWCQIEKQLAAVPLSEWSRLVYPPWFVAYGLDLQQLTAPSEDSSSVSGTLGGPTRDFVPIEQHRDLSELAVHVARPICARSDRRTPSADVVIFCHSSLNEHVSTTTAGRLCALIGERPFSFSLAQQQGASVFSALRVASDLFLAEPELRAILIVAAEKWCYPFTRRIGRWTMQGDAAGAVLLERETLQTSKRGLRLLATAVQPLCRADAPFGLPASLSETNAIFAASLVALINTLLRQQGLCSGDVTAVVGHQVNGLLVDALSQQLDLPRVHCVVDQRAYLGTAEFIVRLAETLDAVETKQGSLLLAWGIGLGGYVSCALLESLGTPPLCFTDPSPTGQT